MVSYISLSVAIISLLLGVYNWYQSVLRLYVDTKVYNTRDDYWAIEATICNLSARPVSILETRIIAPKNQTVEEAEIRKAAHFYVFMHNGANVGTINEYTDYPFQIPAYGAKTVVRVVLGKPTHMKIGVRTPHKRFRFKIRSPKE